MNEDYIKQTNSTQASLLMTSLDSLREQNSLCDFDVKVGDKSFHAHRCVLAASSGYFKAMFSSKMKESRDGFINMKDVDQNGISLCIEFMYKGGANLKMEYVQQILQASNLLQMVSLTNFCFHYLETNLSRTNCLSVINLAQAYDRHDVKEQAEHVLITNFKSVISSEMFPFIIKPDLLRYIKVSNVSYQTSWQAMITWARAKDEHAERCFGDLVTVINIQTYPFKFLLETVLEEPLVKSNNIAKNSVITVLFSNVKNLETNLEIDNCFMLKNMAETHQVPNLNAVSYVLNRFMEINFEQLIEKGEFCDIQKNDIITLFKSANTKYSSETVKWQAALKWVRHDIRNREQYFHELFSLLRMHCFSLEYLKDSIRFENLVQKSEKCNALLMNEFIRRLTTKPRENPSQMQNAGAGTFTTVTPSNSLKIIQRQPSNGVMLERVLGESLPGYKQWPTRELVFSFQAGEMMGKLYKAQEFVSYLPDSHEGWKVRYLINKAFQAGILFGVEEISQQNGRLIWNPDIPSKTNKTGGIANNGYPDLNYFQNLRDALNAKGIE